MSKEDIELNKELLESLKKFLEELNRNGWEINDDGDIVEKKTQRLIFDIYGGFNHE